MFHSIMKRFAAIRTYLSLTKGRLQSHFDAANVSESLNTALLIPLAANRVISYRFVKPVWLCSPAERSYGLRTV